MITGASALGWTRHPLRAPGAVWSRLESSLYRLSYWHTVMLRDWLRIHWVTGLGMDAVLPKVDLVKRVPLRMMGSSSIRFGPTRLKAIPVDVPIPRIGRRNDRPLQNYNRVRRSRSGWRNWLLPVAFTGSGATPLVKYSPIKNLFLWSPCSIHYSVSPSAETRSGN